MIIKFLASMGAYFLIASVVGATAALIIMSVVTVILMLLGHKNF